MSAYMRGVLLAIITKEHIFAEFARPLSPERIYARNFPIHYHQRAYMRKIFSVHYHQSAYMRKLFLTIITKNHICANFS